MNAVINVLTNQYFLLFVTIATGLLLGKVKIGNFSLGVSGGIFTGIIIGWFVMHFAHTTPEGAVGYSSAARLLKNGVVSSVFFTFFLLIFLCAIGLSVGKNIGRIFRNYGIKFVIIGAVIPLVAMIVGLAGYKLAGGGMTAFEDLGMYTGAMTSTPGYGAALDSVSILDMADVYERASDAEKQKLLAMIDETGALTVENTAALTEEQAAALKTAASSATSLGYTVAFPIGVVVIVLMMTFMPKIFRIDIEEEKRRYAEELAADKGKEKPIPDGPLDMMLFGIVAAVGVLVGNITIPLGRFGSFSLGAAGGVLLSALFFSFIGKIGPFNFRMDTKGLIILRDMGLTFFMANAGLNYGYDVVSSLAGSGLNIAIMAIFAEGLAVLVSFFIGRKLFKLNWVILSGAISGGCTSAPGLGAAISSLGGSDEPSAGYGAAQPFAILANVLLATLFFNIVY